MNWACYFGDTDGSSHQLFQKATSSEMMTDD